MAKKRTNYSRYAVCAVFGIILGVLLSFIQSVWLDRIGVPRYREQDIAEVFFFLSMPVNFWVGVFGLLWFTGSTATQTESHRFHRRAGLVGLSLEICIAAVLIAIGLSPLWFRVFMGLAVGTFVIYMFGRSIAKNW